MEKEKNWKIENTYLVTLVTLMQIPANEGREI
jgi:hypothetical protein